ncbi:MAG: protein kinase [Deltaproteobacteria bacterium]|nr:protein kinase [Deltaproteobacteria bacterium]
MPLPSEGTLIADRYRLSREIGCGGMGAVWAATDEKLARSVAIKLMMPRPGRQRTAFARFKREAMAVARLSSPHIVQVHDYGVWEDTPYIVMQLLSGDDLSAKLSRHGTLPLDTVTRLVAQTAKALTVAHEAGIVHRDLKPSNIFLERDARDEQVRVFDFGIAKPLRDEDSTEVTAEGATVGTPAYMSPEQVYGSKDVDERSDLWALAVIAYRALTGRKPFDGAAGLELLSNIANTPHVPPSVLADELPPAIDEFFEQALAKDPDDRFQSAQALANELARIADVSISFGLSEGPLSSRLPTMEDQALSRSTTPHDPAMVATMEERAHRAGDDDSAGGDAEPAAEEREPTGGTLEAATNTLEPALRRRRMGPWSVGLGLMAVGALAGWLVLRNHDDREGTPAAPAGAATGSAANLVQPAADPSPPPSEAAQPTTEPSASPAPDTSGPAGGTGQPVASSTSASEPRSRPRATSRPPSPGKDSPPPPSSTAAQPPPAKSGADLFNQMW